MKKKCGLVILTVILCFGISWAQKYKRVLLPAITSPSSTDVWHAGNTYTIVWRAQDFSHPTQKHVKITLWDRLLRKHKLTIGIVSNTGSYPWNIPASTLSGEYRIKIKLVKNPKIANSAIFSIKGKQPRFARTKPEIKITSPGTRSNWPAGTEKTIKFRTEDQDRFVLELWHYKNPTKIMNVLGAIVNTTPKEKLGKYECQWKIPANIKPAKYRIRVLANNGNNAFSPRFTISTSLKKEIIKINPSLIDNQQHQYAKSHKEANQSKFDESKCPPLVPNPGKKRMHNPT